MRPGSPVFVLIILGIFYLIDAYVFKGFKSLIVDWNSKSRLVFTILYWSVPVVITILSVVIGNMIPNLRGGVGFYRVFYTFMGIIILFYVPKLLFCVFELGNDIFSLFSFVFSKFNVTLTQEKFQLFRYVGGVVSLAIFVATFYGIVHGKFNYKVNHQKIQFERLPASYDGFKVVHISDWHIGSFFKKPHRIQAAVNKINALEPDLILFTGDMVNNVADEMLEFIPQLSQLKAKCGIYSVLGNHDYGEYVSWKSEAEKKQNMVLLHELEDKVGFTLLDNKMVLVDNGVDTIQLAGVENWGKPPFPQYGDLSKALQNANKTTFTILMSHDPSHWDAEIRNTPGIDLTLSGHTHGMQFGIKTQNFQWSPVKMKYPRWGGLYTEANHKLFVSVGIGYIAFPGRVGIRPEIALLELKTNK